MAASCSSSSSAHEAVLVMQGTTVPVLADVTDPVHPLTICTISGPWKPQLVTQTMVSWYASQSQGNSSSASAIVTLDVFSGISAVVATWQGGGFMDGLYAWSPDQSLLAYVTSDASAVSVHLLSGGGDRVVATLGAVLGSGGSIEDDAYLGFSPDGGYFALVQTFTSSGDHVQVRRATDGGLAYSQATGTMATWGSTGSRLYFRQLQAAAVFVWDPTGGLTQAFGQQLAWIRPRADAGDDYLAFTVRDSAGTPHIWLYGHSGRAGGMLAIGVRSSPAFLTTTAIFIVEEAPCAPTCGLSPPTKPNGRTFVYDMGRAAESPSTISTFLGSWPRPGQI